MAWVLIASLKQLFAEFDRVAPNRDKASDGSIGDTAHQATSSDHNSDETGNVPIHDADSINEVHAIDVDDDLREPGLTMEAVVQFLLGRCRSGTEKRLRYIIYNRRIWSASSDWIQKTYTGSSPHTEHAHFSASYMTALEASTASWHLEDIPMALTAADKNTIRVIVREEIEAQRNDIANDVHQWNLGAPPGADQDKWPSENMDRNTYNEAKDARQRVEALDNKIDAVQAKLDQLLALLDPGTSN